MNTETLMSTFHGVDIHCVPAGTEIYHQGEKLIVTDENAVNLGRSIYCTEKVVNALKKLSTDISRKARADLETRENE